MIAEACDERESSHPSCTSLSLSLAVAGRLRERSDASRPLPRRRGACSDRKAARRTLSRARRRRSSATRPRAMRRASDSIWVGQLAQRAGVPFEPVVFPKNAEVFAAAKSGSVDMVFTNATPARRNDLDFSPTVLQVEQGYLVPAGSTIRALDEIDRAGVRVGVSEGSTSEATLSRELRNATVVRTPSLKAAIDMLAAGKLEAFATNKADAVRDGGRTARLARARRPLGTGELRHRHSEGTRGGAAPGQRVSSARPRPTARWREPSSERDCAERCCRISGVCGTATLRHRQPFQIFARLRQHPACVLRLDGDT